MIRKLLQSLQRIETMYDLKSITEEQYAMMELMNDRLAPCIPKEKCRGLSYNNDRSDET